MIAALPPWPVAGPLAVAGLLLTVERLLPSRIPDVAAILTALATAGVCAVMAAHAADAPLVYWFGGWAPRGPQVLGIGFAVDQAGAALAAFIGVLFVAAFVFAWGYFDEVGAHFHVLMLLFMAGMVGFCLTHDLFNLFVWFELMSVAAFALTGYQLRSSALEGALNFTVANTVGSYLFLGGLGLLYARAGALDFSVLGRAVAAHPDDVVTYASFALMATGFLVKAAQVPFHFWLADAHTVAPSPVSVIFSGAMVALGLFGLLRLVLDVFAGAAAVAAVVQTLLLGMGAVTAVAGGAMALLQRHLKRLLAFSTISHTGIMLAGLAMLDRGGLGGMLAYFVGHGLVKGALFMVAGILLATRASIDEIGLRGLGRDLWPVGAAMALGGLLLAGLPLGTMDGGMALIGGAALSRHQAWVAAAVFAGSALTGAAVLRAAGRIFLGLGPEPDSAEQAAPTEEEQEKADRPVWLMLLPTAALLGLALPFSDHASGFALHAAGGMMPPAMPGASAAATRAPDWLPWCSVALALAVAAWQLERQRLPPGAARTIDGLFGPLAHGLQAVHSGQIGDYVAWITVGLALFAGAFWATAAG